MTFGFLLLLGSLLSSQNLQVMTFNLRHRDRPYELRMFSDYLRDQNRRTPDIILCQEVVFERDRGPEDTAGVWKRALGPHYHSIAEARLSDLEGVAIISRHPFIYESSLQYKARQRTWINPRTRVAVMGEIQWPHWGLIRVATVHLEHSQLQKEVRRRQIQETLQWLSDRDQEVKADFLILGGDFNALIEAEEMKFVLDSPFEFFNPNSLFPTFRQRRIDLIFIASMSKEKKVSLIEERILPRDISDHSALLMTFQKKDL